MIDITTNADGSKLWLSPKRGTEKDVPYTLTGCVPTTCTLPSAEASSEFFAEIMTRK